MITEIISNSFTADKRTSMQRVTFDKSDDLFMLASKQRRYEDIRATILNPPEGYDVTGLQAELEALKAEIAEYEGYIASYREESNQ